MPELPEVETIRRDLEKKIKNKKISRLQILKSSVARGGGKSLGAFVAGKKVRGIDRRGKLIILRFVGTDDVVLFHLKMTGQLIYRDKSGIVAGGHDLLASSKRSGGGPNLEEFNKLPDKHTQAIFYFQGSERNERAHSRASDENMSLSRRSRRDKPYFTGGAQLFFNDMRRFGYIKLARKDQLSKILSGLGLEPLSKNFTLEVFKMALRIKSTTIKAALLDQYIIAGLGNIYSDEVCFCAGVMPDRKIPTLTAEEQKKLFECIKKILALAIKHRGTTFSDYRDCDGEKGCFVNFLKVYNRKGEKCLRCKKGIIQKKKIAGRGSSFCPGCQT